MNNPNNPNPNFDILAFYIMWGLALLYFVLVR